MRTVRHKDNYPRHTEATSERGQDFWDTVEAIHQALRCPYAARCDVPGAVVQYELREPVWSQCNKEDSYER